MSELGNCFENSARALIDMPAIADVQLVHALVTGKDGSPVEGLRYGHAFLVIGPLVLDMTTDKVVVVEKREYYAVGKVEEIATYRRDEMMRMLRAHRHFGPWDTKLAAYP